MRWKNEMIFVVFFYRKKILSLRQYPLPLRCTERSNLSVVRTDFLTKNNVLRQIGFCGKSMDRSVILTSLVLGQKDIKKRLNLGLEVIARLSRHTWRKREYVLVTYQKWLRKFGQLVKWGFPDISSSIRWILCGTLSWFCSLVQRSMCWIGER